ncbi:hypothetical protein DUNSADRAFT_8490, partial [Dunaliella salina]
PTPLVCWGRRETACLQRSGGARVQRPRVQTKPGKSKSERACSGRVHGGTRRVQDEPGAFEMNLARSS